MNCDKIKYYLSLYINGMLPAEKKNVINQHLLLCDTCKKYAEALQRQKISIQLAVKKTELPESIPEAISMAISATKEEKPYLRLLKNFSWGALTKQFKIAAAAAAVILLALTTYFVLISNKVTDGQLIPISGKIVCVGCQLKHDHGMPYDCKAKGHIPVIKTNDGKYYNFNVAETQLNSISKEDMYGCTIDAVGYVYTDEHYVQIIAVNSIQKGSRL